MALSYVDRDGFIWLDGQMHPWREAKTHVLTHALHYASSVFEGERAYNGKIFESRQHSQRLHASADMLCIDLDWTVDQIEDAKYRVLEANNLKDAYVRAIVWRGTGPDMGVNCHENPVHFAIAAWEWGPYYGDAKDKSGTLDISEWHRPSPQTAPVKAKASGLYMICTLAKRKAAEKGCDDALMFDYRGYIAEATGANIFFAKDGEVHTPIPDCFLDGITRQTVINLLQQKNITVHERYIKPEELSTFQQCWLTGTAAEITPIGQIAEHRFEVGTLLKDIKDDYESLVRS